VNGALKADELTRTVETICDSLRARLPGIVATEVRRQLHAQAPRLLDLEALAQRALNAHRARGVPDAPPTPPRPRGEALDEIARIRSRGS
jgi:hypothetical protein